MLSLILDVALKLRDLRSTIVWMCHHPRPDPGVAVHVLNNKIVDMNIDYHGHRILPEMSAIESILGILRGALPLCRDDDDAGSLDYKRSHDLMKNVTVSLFANIGVKSPVEDYASVNSRELLTMYLKQLEFVFAHYLVLGALSMFMFAIFVVIVSSNTSRVRKTAMIGTRVGLGATLLGFVALFAKSNAVHAFMTSPWVLFIFTAALLVGKSLLLAISEKRSPL